MLAQLVIQWFWIALASAALPSNKFSPFDLPDFCSQIITPTCNATFLYIDELNHNIRPQVSDLMKTHYFRYFKLNLDKQCKFWNAQHFCATANCAVEILEPDQFNWTDINANLMPAKLGKIVSDPEQETDQCDELSDNLDYTHIDDDHQCVYVNLVDNPERFTGYGGNQSFDVWRAIYAENCFPNTNPMSMDASGEKESCVEKNLFYRLILGMHALIAVHLANEYLCPETSEFYPNLRIFMERVGLFNDRLSNIYFNYALVSQAITKLNTLFDIKGAVINDTSSSAFEASGEDDAALTSDLLDQIVPALSLNTLFDTSNLFDPASVAPSLKDEFRSRFKNVSAIMDCVGCDRCRMWGKLQTTGYGTALKILLDGEVNPKLKRIELVALLNTFDRLSKSIEAINNFKAMYMQHLEDVRAGITKPGEYEKKESGFAFPFINKDDLRGSPAGSEKSAAKSTESDATSAKSASEKSKAGSKRPEFRKMPVKTIVDPERQKKILNKELRGFTDELQTALDEVWGAVQFVLGSYRDFPVTCFRLAVYYTSIGWDKFIGTPKKYDVHSGFKIEDPPEPETHMQ